jgi:hypothetical protein
MDSSDRSVTIVTAFICTMLAVMCLLVSNCKVQETQAEQEMNKIVRIECIRQGGNWGVVSTPGSYTEYGCLKK